MLSSGALQGIMSDMTVKMEDGSLDMAKMISAVQGMMGDLGQQEGVPPEIAQMTSQLGQLLAAPPPSRVPTQTSSHESILSIKEEGSN